MPKFKVVRQISEKTSLQKNPLFGGLTETTSDPLHSVINKFIIFHNIDDYEIIPLSDKSILLKYEIDL